MEPARRVTVALIVYGALDRLSGGYAYDTALAERLRARGHEIVVLSQRDAGFLGRLASNGPGIGRRIRRVGADLVLIDELNHPSLFLSRRALRRGGAPLVLIVHHLRSDEALPALVRRAVRWMERRLLTAVDAYVFNSRSTAGRCAALAGGPLEPSAVVYPGAENPFGRPRRRDGGMRVLFVGSLIPRKGLHRLIAALGGLEAEWSLDVVGDEGVDPGYAARCRRDAAGMAGDRIRFHGRLSGSELDDLRGRAEILAVPSDYEGFGIVYLEAMRAGLVPVASARGGAAELLRDGVDGILVDPDRPEDLEGALVRLAADPDEAERLARSARRRAESFPDWTTTMNRAAEFLEDLPARRSSDVEGAVRHYYDRNTRRFLRFGQGGAARAIHRAVRHPDADDPFRWQESRILAVLRESEADAVMDLGCGVGSSLHWLAERHAASYAGVTLSPLQARMAAAASADPKIRIRQGSYLDDAAYDGLPPQRRRTLFFGIESWLHCSDGAAFFAVVARHARPGDMLALWDDFRRAAGAPEEVRSTLEDFRIGWHAVNLQAPDDTDRLAREAGFDLVSDEDFTPWLDIDRFRDRLIALFVPVLRPLNLNSPWWRNLQGGNALRRALNNGWIAYRFRVWTRRAT